MNCILHNAKLTHVTVEKYTDHFLSALHRRYPNVKSSNVTCRGHVTVSNDRSSGQKRSFVSATVKQSREDGELHRPSNIVPPSSSCAEDRKQSESQTVMLLNKTEAGCSERDYMYEVSSKTSVSS